MNSHSHYLISQLLWENPGQGWRLLFTVQFNHLRTRLCWSTAMDERDSRQLGGSRKPWEFEAHDRWRNGRLVKGVNPFLWPRFHNSPGFKGQARVILPTITSCYECSLDMLNKPTAFPICTIANTPRLPEHCIEWASVLEWPRVHGGKSLYLYSSTPSLISRR